MLSCTEQIILLLEHWTFLCDKMVGFIKEKLMLEKEINGINPYPTLLKLYYAFCIFCKISNVGSEGNWTWTHSKEPITDSSWGANFPNTYYNNTDDCGLMVVEPTELYWKDTSCSSTTTVDGKKVAPVCQHDRECPEGWKLFKARCYLLAESAATWADAENDCNRKGGHLASVHSADENTFIFNLPSSPTNLYIGATDAAVEVG